MSAIRITQCALYVQHAPRGSCPQSAHHMLFDQLILFFIEDCLISTFIFKFSRVFDNEFTVAFGIFMSLWGSFFIDFWKRQSVTVSYYAGQDDRWANIHLKFSLRTTGRWWSLRKTSRTARSLSPLPMSMTLSQASKSKYVKSIAFYVTCYLFQPGFPPQQEVPSPLCCFLHCALADHHCRPHRCFYHCVPSGSQSFALSARKFKWYGYLCSVHWIFLFDPVQLALSPPSPPLFSTWSAWWVLVCSTTNSQSDLLIGKITAARLNTRRALRSKCWLLFLWARIEIIMSLNRSLFSFVNGYSSIFYIAFFKVDELPFWVSLLLTYLFYFRASLSGRQVISTTFLDSSKTLGLHN